MKVVCVDASSGPGYWWDGEEIFEGAVYTIHSTFEGPNGLGPLVRLVEVKRHPDTISCWGHDGYCASRFIPVQTKSTETGMAILRGLLDTSPVSLNEEVG